MLRGVRTGVLVGGVAAGMVLGAAMGMAADEPANLIKYRQATMKAIGGHMGALAALAKGEVSFNDEAIDHVRAINTMSQNLARLFPDGTAKGATEVKTAALDEIWHEPQVFEEAIQKLQDQSAQLLEVAQSGDQVQFAQSVGQLGKQACGNCHERFREKDE